MPPKPDPEKESSLFALANAVALLPVPAAPALAPTAVLQPQPFPNLTPRIAYKIHAHAGLMLGEMLVHASKSTVNQMTIMAEREKLLPLANFGNLKSVKEQRDSIRTFSAMDFDRSIFAGMNRLTVWHLQAFLESLDQDVRDLMANEQERLPEDLEEFQARFPEHISLPNMRTLGFEIAALKFTCAPPAKSLNEQMLVDAVKHLSAECDRLFSSPVNQVKLATADARAQFAGMATRLKRRLQRQLAFVWVIAMTLNTSLTRYDEQRAAKRQRVA